MEQKSNHYQALVTSVKASDQIGLKIDFSNGQVEWLGDRPAFLQESSSLPLSFDEFIRNVNPADLPRLLNDIKPVNIDSVIDSYRIISTFRYRFDNGEHLSLCLQGEVEANDNGSFSGMLGVVVEQDTGVDDNDADDIAVDTRAARVHTTRNRLIEVLAAALDDNRGKPDNSKTGVLLLIGLDRLSLFNQAYGGNFVDSLLTQVEQQLKEIMVEDGGILIRLSGDQYACFYGDMPTTRMEEGARRVLARLNHTNFRTLQGAVRLNASIGGVSIAEKVKHEGDYVVMAEAALANAKSAGRGRFVAYARDRVTSAVDIRRLLKGADSFLRCFEEGRLKLAFQPVVRSKTDRDVVSFYECLLRMVDEEERIIPAGHFIGQIESLGLAHIADQFSLHQAVTELKAFPELRLSVNVSNTSLNDPAWLRSAISLLRDCPDVARRLVIEITETSVMQDIRQSMRVTRALHELGCRLALDDFGAGYSSFIQMRELSPDIVKIDKHFISHIDDRQNQIFIDAIQMLAEGFQLETVGEGAETIREATILEERGVNNIQGYAYGYPSISRLWLPKGHDMRDSELAHYGEVELRLPNIG